MPLPGPREKRPAAGTQKAADHQENMENQTKIIVEPIDIVVVKMEPDDEGHVDEHHNVAADEGLPKDGLNRQDGVVESVAMEIQQSTNQGMWDTNVFSERSQFCCVKCGLLTTTRRQLVSHMRKEHDGEEDKEVEEELASSGQEGNDEPLDYSICGRGCELPQHSIEQPDGRVFKYYRITEKPRESRFACDLCNYVAGNGSHLAKHKQMHAGSEHAVCKVCGYMTDSLCQLKRHETVHSEEKPFACEFCDYRAAHQYSLNYHMGKHNKRFACELCDYRGLDSRSLKRHMRRHTGERPYPCDECDYRGAQLANLIKHKKTHAAAKRFNCGMCDYRCSNSITMATHRLTHTDEGPFACSACGYTTDDLKDALKHRKSHRQRKVFSCDICDYKSFDSSNVKKHAATHLAKSQRPYKCDMCQYRSADSGALKKHMRKHTGERLYSCKLCRYGANTLRQLERHAAKHSDPAVPYLCDECGFATRRRKRLILHIGLNHRDSPEDKPFCCRLCDYRAAQQASLHRHMNKHTGVKPFRCQLCHFSTAYLDSLKKHSKLHEPLLNQFEAYAREAQQPSQQTPDLPPWTQPVRQGAL